MASMNNWLGFSLSPQEVVPTHNHEQQLILSTTNHVSGGECFDLTCHNDSILPSLNLPALHFGILEAFNTNTESQGADWNVKDLNIVSSDTTKYRTSSEVCEIMENNRSNINGNNHQAGEPKLENFLGVGGHNNHHQPIDSSNSTIGLSMIKNWLRNNPSSNNQSPDNKNDHTSATTAQTLSLSMSTGSQLSSTTSLPLLNGGGENKQQNGACVDTQKGAVTETTLPRKSIDTFGQRTSIYRGVTRHRWTGRYEAHLWDNSCRREGQTRKGRQVYLGGYDKEEKAARSYDLAALKYWGTATTTNFPISEYEKEVEEMKHMTRQEFIASLRRKSSGFSRGASIYRGVTRHHQHGRWQARIGRVAGNKDLYLGTFGTQEEAAEAYDIAAIKFRGLNAVTNFEMSRYDVKTILESSTLPVGSTAKRLKDAELMSLQAQRNIDVSHHLLDHGMNTYNNHPWSTIAFQQAQPDLNTHHAYGGQQRLWCKQENDHSFQDFHQLQFGNPHNFVQPSVLHNLMNLDSSTMEHSSGSNSVIYSGGSGDGDGNGNDATFNGTLYANSNSGYMLPMATIVQNQNQANAYGDTDQVKSIGYENMFGSTDSYQARNLYYQQSPNGTTEKSSVYDQSSSCNTWVPTSLEARSASNMATLCHDAQTFTVWNDT